MASGPWDNVSLAGPPNGPAWIQAAMQAMQGTGNAVNNAFNAYQQGQNFQYQQAGRNLFRNGLPTLPNGDPDYGAAFQRMIQQGGTPVAQQVLPSLIDLSLQQQNSGAIHNLVGGGSAPNPAVGNAAGPANVTGNFNQPNLSATGGDTQPGGQNIQTLTAGIASGRGIEDVPLNVMKAFASALGVKLDTPLNAQQESKARKLISYQLPNQQGIQGGATPNYGGGNPVAQPGNPDQENGAEHLTPSGIGGSSAMTPRQTSMRGQPLRVTVHPDQSAVAGDGFEDRFRPTYYGGTGGQQVAQNRPPIDPRQIDELERRANEAFDVSGRPRMSPQQAEAARKIGEQLQTKARELREQNLKYSSPEFNPTVKGNLSRFEAADKAVGEQISEYVKGMPAARQMLNHLDVMEDSLRHAGNNLTVGPGHEFITRAKQVLSNYANEPVKGLSEAEVVTKMNAFLASEAAKQLTSRPSQAEFKAFLQNNPGLQNSVDGTIKLIDILRQTTNQRVDLGKLGSNRSNWPNWGAVEDTYFRQNPIHMPFSSPGGIGAPGAGGQPQGQTAPGRYQWTPQGGLQRVQ